MGVSIAMGVLQASIGWLISGKIQKKIDLGVALFQATSIYHHHIIEQLPYHHFHHGPSPQLRGWREAQSGEQGVSGDAEGGDVYLDPLENCC